MKEIFILIIDLLLLAGIVFWHHKRQPEELRNMYWFALALKLLASFSLGAVYFYYYGQGDTILYWRDGMVLSDNFFSDPITTLQFFWDENSAEVTGLLNNRPRSIFFVKIAGVLAMITHGNYWMMALIIASTSFFSAWYLFRKVISFFPEATWAAAISFLFYPSIVFWSSGLIKESLALAALFFLAGFFLTLIMNERPVLIEWIAAIVSIWIAWNLKYYWIGVFIPVAFTTVIVSLVSRNHVVKKFDIAVWLGVFAVLLLIGTSVHPNFYPSRFLEVIYQNNIEFMSIRVQGNAVLYDHLEPTLSSVLANSPQALVAGFLRPFVWEGNNFLSLAAGFENLILTVLILTSISRVFVFLKSPYRLLAMAVLVYAIILSVFLSLSTPNLGTLSRYKIGFLPFLVFIVLYKNPILSQILRSRSQGPVVKI